MISGIIENVRKIITTTELIRSYLRKYVGRIILYPTITMFAFILMFTLHYMKLSDEDPTLIIQEKMKQSLGASWIWVLISMAFLATLYSWIEDTYKAAPIEVIQKVPKNIIP